MSQLSFARLAFQEKKKVTRREKFLGEMGTVIPWKTMESIIAPYYPRKTNAQGRPPMPLLCMLRIYFMQQWFGLSDPGMEDALYDSAAIQGFAGIDLGRDAVPDETTILKFRHLLENHNLTQRIFNAVNRHLEDKGVSVREGTIMDATIIHAPSSTKNAGRQRDEEMGSTKKGNQWHFGMKAHIGAHSKTGLVHTVVCTTASVHDSMMADDLLHGQETAIYGDKAYADNTRKEDFLSRGIAWRVNIKASRSRQLTDRDIRWNRSRNRTRARVEHAFGVVKNQWGYRKVRYRGIYKNACQMFTLFALSNIYRVRLKLMKPQKCAL